MNLQPFRAPRPARLLSLLAALAAATLMAACGGGGDGTTDTRPEFAMLPGGQACGGGGCGGDSGDGGGVGSGADGGDGAGGGLGEMRNVKVTARKPDGTVLASANLQGNLVSIYPGRYSGNAFILEFADDGSGRGEYYDEGTMGWTALGATRLRVLVPDLTHHVSANPLAEAAYQWAINKWGSESALDAARMTEANNTVRDAFNARTPVEYRVTDVTNYTVAVSDATVANSLPNTHAGRMGTLMAAIPRAALRFNSALGSPALAFLRQLAKDVQDDGSVNSSVQDGDSVAYGVDLPGTLADAVVDARSQYGRPEQPGPTAAASQCLNPALYAAGTTVDLLYDVFDGETTSSQRFVATITGGASFNGVNGLLRERMDLGGGLVADNYVSPDLSAGILRYGSVASFIGQDRTTWTATTVYDQPYLDTTFLLRPDSTATISYTGAMTIRDSQGTVQPGSPQRVASSEQVYFAGYETVSVIAGTFVNACRYETAASTTVTISWFTSSGQGVAVLTEERDLSSGFVFSRSELNSGTVNGVPVVGSSNQFRANQSRTTAR